MMDLNILSIVQCRRLMFYICAIFKFYLKKCLVFWGDLFKERILDYGERNEPGTCGGINMAGLKRPIWAFLNIFLIFPAFGCALSCRRITLSYLWSHYSCFSRNAWIKQISCSLCRSLVMESEDFSRSLHVTMFYSH